MNSGDRIDAIASAATSQLSLVGDYCESGEYCRDPHTKRKMVPGYDLATPPAGHRGVQGRQLFWSQEVHKKAKEPKELFVVDGATHIDLYDRPQFVTPAVAKLTAFFSQHLSTAGGSR